MQSHFKWCADEQTDMWNIIIAQNNIQFYTCDAVSIARSLGLRGRTNTVLQAAFFKLINILPIEDAVQHMKAAIKKGRADR